MALIKLHQLAISIALLSCLTLATANSATKTQIQTFTLPTESSEESAPKAPETAIPDDALPEFNVKSGDATDEDASQAGDQIKPAALPPVLRNLELLPAAVRETHAKLIDAAKSADLEKLRPLIGSGETATSLSIGGLAGDPIIYLKESSGDENGYELLAILLEVLEAGYVHVDAGTESEMYIWPYFFAWPFEKLTPQMEVELYRILTAGDVQDSVDFGGYIFYRVGIRPDGKWDFFVAGD
ncbi:MAG: cytoplasmic protein [Rhizobiaceae bacterium]